MDDLNRQRIPPAAQDKSRGENPLCSRLLAAHRMSVVGPVATTRLQTLLNLSCVEWDPVDLKFRSYFDDDDSGTIAVYLFCPKFDEREQFLVGYFTPNQPRFHQINQARQ